ncbi:hypothetical protein QQ045_013726 [Rhodiola kirilowii]
MSRWEEDTFAEKQAFNRLGIWAQFHDVPEQLMISEDTARKLANMVGEFSKLDQGEGSSQNFKYVRCRVWLDVSKPIITGFLLARRGKDPLQITVRYEHMPRFCHHCGVWSHETEECNRKSKSMASAYEAWLRGSASISEVVENGETEDKSEWQRQSGKKSEYQAPAESTKDSKEKTLAEEANKVANDWAGPINVMGQLGMAWERVGDTESGVHSQIFDYKGSSAVLSSLAKTTGGKQKAIYSSRKNKLKVRVSDLKRRAREGERIRLTVFYGNPATQKRSETWDLLRRLSMDSNLPWVVIGDFNEVLFSWEVEGRRLRKEWQMRSFRETIDACGLVDLGYSGLPFTFSNKQAGLMETKARLDRAFGNVQWKTLFDRYEVTHLITSTSDHLPILVNFRRRLNCVRKKLFRFKPMWLRHSQFRGFLEHCWTKRDQSNLDLTLKLKGCGRELAKWNSDVFGRVHKRIGEVKNQIEVLKSKFRTEEVIEKEAKLQSELDEWLAREELLWKQRSIVDWLREGDSNTIFFHSRASQRRKKNSIERIRGNNNSWITDEIGICKEAVRHFSSILRSTSPTGNPEWRISMAVVNSSVSADRAAFLCSNFSRMEIQNTMFQIGSTKAPGPDGFSALFFHENWNLVKEDIFQCALGFLNEGSELNKEMNETLITLVPKSRSPSTFDEFRPISLCNVVMKVITKALANRLKIVLQECISPSQSAFVPGRLITDNVLIAHELMSYLWSRSNKNAGYCCIKIDMSKAYDRMEWRFLEDMQKRWNFPPAWIDKVMACVRSVTYRIRVNGVISEKFDPEREIRQGIPYHLTYS